MVRATYLAYLSEPSTASPASASATTSSLMVAAMLVVAFVPSPVTFTAAAAGPNLFAVVSGFSPDTQSNLDFLYSSRAVAVLRSSLDSMAVMASVGSVSVESSIPPLVSTNSSTSIVAFESQKHIGLEPDAIPLINNMVVSILPSKGIAPLTSSKDRVGPSDVATSILASPLATCLVQFSAHIETNMSLTYLAYYLLFYYFATNPVKN